MLQDRLLFFKPLYLHLSTFDDINVFVISTFDDISRGILVKKIYSILPVIFFTERARGLDFPPAPLPPFVFLHGAPLFLFFGFYFCVVFGVLTVQKRNFWGFSFAVVLVYSCCWWWWFVYMVYNVLVINLHSFGVVIFRDFLCFCFGGFLIWIFIFIFLLLWCFYPILFFIFLVVFGGFLDFSLIFFSGFCFAFTHQKGYNF